MYMRLAESDRFQMAYKFTYDGEIKMGNCGTLVINSRTKELYGFIIAHSKSQHIGFIKAAEPFKNDIMELGWHLVALEDVECKYAQKIPSRSSPHPTDICSFVWSSGSSSDRNNTLFHNGTYRLSRYGPSRSGRS
jgi:hypothetical protein